MKAMALAVVLVLMGADAPRDPAKMTTAELRAAVKQLATERDELAARIEKLEREIWSMKNPGKAYPATQPAARFSTINDVLKTVPVDLLPPKGETWSDNRIKLITNSLQKNAVGGTYAGRGKLVKTFTSGDRITGVLQGQTEKDSPIPIKTVRLSVSRSSDRSSELLNAKAGDIIEVNGRLTSASLQFADALFLDLSIRE